jgi:Zn-dependent protease
MRIPGENLRQVNPTYGYTKGKISFSKTEILHIVAAILVLGLAFSFAMRRSKFDDDPTTNIMLIVGMSFILVICSFLLHEFGHKFVAQRYHAWSEFRAYPYGLVMAFLFAALIGVLFAAPGAVYIRGNIDKDTNGKISLAGPAVNFIIAAIAIAVLLILEPGAVGTLNGLVYALFQMLAWLNAFLGIFNMIPVLPFDGSKIWKWNLPVYLIAVVVGIAELAYVWFYIMS